MRLIIYIVAAIAVAGVVYYATQQNTDVASNATEETLPAASVSESDAGETTTTLVTLKVPQMHCPVGCYPKVKKTLEQETGVLAVDLAEQVDASKIDNPQVLIKVTGDFDADKAIDALTKAHFKDSSLVQ